MIHSIAPIGLRLKLRLLIQSAWRPPDTLLTDSSIDILGYLRAFNGIVVLQVALVSRNVEIILVLAVVVVVFLFGRNRFTPFFLPALLALTVRIVQLVGHVPRHMGNWSGRLAPWERLGAVLFNFVGKFLLVVVCFVSLRHELRNAGPRPLSNVLGLCLMGMGRGGRVNSRGALFLDWRLTLQPNG